MTGEMTDKLSVRSASWCKKAREGNGRIRNCGGFLALKSGNKIGVAFLALVLTNLSWASDACSEISIATRAAVTVSNGDKFDVRSQYHSAGGSIITHIRDQESTIGAEGPFSWTTTNSGQQTGTDFHKIFALGHQFHAFLLHFAEMVREPVIVTDIPFQGAQYSAIRGAFPYGGAVFLIDGENEAQPRGLRFEFEDTAPIEVVFSGWRINDDAELPFSLRIDDGELIFNYNFSEVLVDNIDLLEFYASSNLPKLDLLEIYRLHRKLLAAHCLGDAELMAKLTAPDVLVASRGALLHTNPAATMTRFSATFERFDYTNYVDLTFPEIEYSAADGIGWIAVNVQAAGQDLRDQQDFDDQWAWIMLARKIDGRWLHAGNAANSLD